MKYEGIGVGCGECGYGVGVVGGLCIVGMYEVGMRLVHYPVLLEVESGEQNIEKFLYRIIALVCT